jgi:hypothetical protein
MLNYSVYYNLSIFELTARAFFREFISAHALQKIAFSRPIPARLLRSETKPGGPFASFHSKKIRFPAFKEGKEKPDLQMKEYLLKICFSLFFSRNCLKVIFII